MTQLSERSFNLASMVTLILLTLIAFANSWPDALVFDDKFFAGIDRKTELNNLLQAFSVDAWNTGGWSGLYRPLLLINLELESRLFGDWNRGYHLVNIGLHVMTTLLLYGFLRKLLRLTARQPGNSDLCALVAALVFAVHPAHTEVINSVFNGSSLYVSLLALAGLWWLIQNLDSKPAVAWLGLGIAYFLALLFKESALTLPGIAVAMVIILTPGTFLTRVRRILPVFWLLIPLIVYFLLRAQALTPGGTESAGTVQDVYGLSVVIEQGHLPNSKIILGAAAVVGQAMKVIFWPHPLYLYYESPGDVMRVMYLLLNIAMLGSATILFFRGRPALALGLAFFYLAILPASRLIGGDGNLPHLAERYLYYPSIGLAIVLAFANRSVAERFSARPIVFAALPLLIVLTALTWDRNTDWGNQVLLFETEYARGQRGPNSLRLLVEASKQIGDLHRIELICDDHVPEQELRPGFADECGMTLINLGEFEKAKNSFEWAARNEAYRPKAYLNLSVVHAKLGDADTARKYYIDLLELVDDPAAREYAKAELLFRIHSHSRRHISQAAGHLEKALEIEPDYRQAKALLDAVHQILNSEATVGTRDSELNDP